MKAHRKSQTAARVVRQLVVLASLAFFASGASCFGSRIVEGPRATGTVIILSEPQGARVVFDGTVRGATYKDKPLVIKGVVYGRHTVRALFPLRVTAVVDFDVNKPETTVRIPLSKEGFGRLTIKSEPPGAEVYIDSRYYGKTDPELVLKSLSYGGHSMWLRLEGHFMERQNIVVERQADRTYIVTLNKEQ